MREIDVALYVSVHPTERTPSYVVLFRDNFSRKQAWRVTGSLESLAKDGITINWPWVVECLVQTHMWRGPATVAENFVADLFEAH